VLAENQRNGFEVTAAMTRRRTEITIESSRRLIVCEFGGSLTGWCDDCLAEVRMMTPNEAAARTGLSSRTIYRWIEEGKIHFSEQSGIVLVCGSSLDTTDVKGRRALPLERGPMDDNS
jgi:Helix-turn-helix domain